MPRALLSINQLSEFHYEQVVMLETIRYLVTNGWLVDVYTHYYGGACQEEIGRWDLKDQILIIDQWSHDGYEFDNHYEFLWVQDSIFSADMLSRLESIGIESNIVFSHLSTSPTTYFNPYLEGQLADSILCVSSARAQVFIQAGISPDKIESDYWVAEHFCKSEHYRRCDNPSHALIITEQSAQEVHELQKQLMVNGITSDCVTSGAVSVAQFNSADVVISTLEGVAYALCMGIPAYVYGEHGGIGYLSDKNIQLAIQEGFSASESSRKIDIASLINELRSGFEIALNFSAAHQAEFINRWRFSQRFSSLLEKLVPPCLKKISEPVARELTLHNKIRKSVALPPYSLARWQQDRRPSATRAILLRTILESQDSLGKIAVVLVDNKGNAIEIKRSLASLSEQLLSPNQLLIISPLAQPDGFTQGEWITSSVHWAEEINTRLTAFNEGYLFVIHSGDLLEPQALLLLAEHRVCNSHSLVCYVDEDVLNGCEPEKLVLKPDSNIDMLRSFPYIGKSLAFSPQHAVQVGGLNAELQDAVLVDLAWRFVEQVGAQALGHVPEVLLHAEESVVDWLQKGKVLDLSATAVKAHLSRLSIGAQVSEGACQGTLKISYDLPVQPLISIVIPTRDNLSVLRKCVESLMERTLYPHYELLIVDNNSQDAAACQFLNQLDCMKLDNIRILRWPDAFNFSAINNYAVEHAHGDVLLFLNNDIEITDSNWLSVLLQHALRPEVGIVGCKLVFSNGSIQHAGFILGLDGAAAIACQGMDGDSDGYLNGLKVTHNVSAVSAACMMMRRDVFTELGGFDTQDFPVYFGDVDLSLKARQLGYLIVWTPEIQLHHQGGATRLRSDLFGIEPQADDAQIDRLFQHWLPQLANDPAYHPAFSREVPGFQFSITSSRCQTPLPGRPLPVVLGCHADWFGCGHYRLIQPFKHLEQNACIEGGLHLGPMINLTDVARVDPDVIILQGVTGEKIPQLMQHYRKYNRAKVVLEYDDYLPNIPVANHARHSISQDVIRRIRRAIEQADWLVVSTPELAKEYEPFHSDIRVALNRLSPELWENLASYRRVSKKARVGWAGGSSHAGDLALIKGVVKALENEVEWVFMGMKPSDVACEFHMGVPIEFYPEKLASLNLDLAIVPLEINQFNRCKSNLRLLEMGACGVPVICTDIEPYRCDLPVTLVNNRFKDWADAIRMHINDMEATSRMGDALRNAIRQNWMLEGKGLESWLTAWMP
ncbi:glycosyltransferase [Pectobacteriaceae bacterium CE90]|nr:glycosyltransferase [Pectobacteriaceae bacterium CE90]